MHKPTTSVEPYRFLFPVALAGALITVGIWILTFATARFGWSGPAYPAIIHSYGVFGLFIFPAVSGFLLTAIPRFSGTHLPAMPTVIAVFIAYVIGLLAFLAQNLMLVCLSSLAGLFLTLLFVLRRMRKSTVSLPVYLQVFIPPGLLAALLGWILILTGLSGTLAESPSAAFLSAGRTALFYYSISWIVLGAGSRIAVTIQSANFEDRNDWRRNLEAMRWQPMVVSLCMALGLALEIVAAVLGQDRSGWLVRTGAAISALAMAFWFLFAFRIYSNTFRRAISTGIWLALWMMLIGLLSRSVTGSTSVHWAHLFFASGLALLTLSVMTRVVLAHGRWDLGSENRSPSLWIVIVLLIGAGATRASAHLLPQSYLNHLGYAAFLFVLAVIVWCLRFLYSTVVQSSKQ